ncbi:GcrA family cell cycle regulator [Devosia sp.]|uniref:GcrA family cell cycle regulator n=1 Tax=Devosia sp. TaxID=1871048 RepID=UPI001AC09C0B|nr:GcrA family cell cycle regulator [Devosia sp.]MBN9334691.1 hypothetical protein [Devosia sp.]
MSGTQTWPDDVVATLKELVREGHSGGQIAKALGLTRNQVVGKVMRMKLQLTGGLPVAETATPAAAIAAKRAPAVTRAVKVKPQIVATSVSAASSAPRPAPPEIAAQRADDYLTSTARRRAFDPAFAPPSAKLVPLVELKRGMCKWPLFESGPAIFCGCAVSALDAVGQPDRYCDDHAKMSRGTS